MSSEAYGLTGSLLTFTAETPKWEVVGPVPGGAVLRAVNVAAQCGSSTAAYTVFLAMSASAEANEVAFRAGSNLVVRSTDFPQTTIVGLRFIAGLGGLGGMRLYVGRKMVGGPRWLIFGAFNGVISGRIAVVVNLEIEPDGGRDRASAGGGTVLDTLRASAADSL